MKNGRDPHYDDPKITSISAARKKAEQAKRAAGGAGRTHGGIVELLAGALIVAMAVGMIVWWTQPLWRAAM